MDIEDSVRQSSVSPSRLWFGLTAAAAAWVLLGFIDILITWRACVHQEQFGNASAHPDARIIYIAVAISLFIVVLTAGTLSYRNWRRISSQRRLLEANATDRREFMALLGVFVSVTLGAGVLWLSIPPLVIEFCLRAK
jgi:divalent metal cation (Fe/Co/Zn/Cd) transporter